LTREPENPSGRSGDLLFIVRYTFPVLFWLYTVEIGLYKLS